MGLSRLLRPDGVYREAPEERLVCRPAVHEMICREKPVAKKIKVKVFDDLRESLQDALAFEQGRAIDLRVTEIPPRPRKLRPRDIRDIRLSLNASQVLFATFLNVSPNTVRSWEQGTRRPQGADLKLLSIAKKNPQALLRA